MSMFEIPGQPGSNIGMMNLNDIFGKALGKKTKKIKVKISESYKILIKEEGFDVYMNYNGELFKNNYPVGKL